MISVGVAVAVAAAVVAAVLLWPAGSGSNKVYAITDVPQVLKAARTLHIKGSTDQIVHEDNRVFVTKHGWEMWVDQDKGLVWIYTTTYAPDSQDKPTRIEEGVTADDYTMVLDRVERTVIFEKLSPFQRLLRTKTETDQFLQQLLGDPRDVSGFTKIGQESIKGEIHELWQREMIVSPNALSLRHKVWLSPRTGRVSRMQAWNRSQEDQPWEPAMTMDTVEYDVTPPENLFQTQPPADYKVVVPKDAAQAPELDMAGGGRLQNYELDFRIGFLLPDGTILWENTIPVIAKIREPLAVQKTAQSQSTAEGQNQ